jgi:hypothetical protein
MKKTEHEKLRDTNPIKITLSEFLLFFISIPGTFEVHQLNDEMPIKKLSPHR